MADESVAMDTHTFADAVLSVELASKCAITEGASNAGDSQAKNDDAVDCPEGTIVSIVLY